MTKTQYTTALPYPNPYAKGLPKAPDDIEVRVDDKKAYISMYATPSLDAAHQLRATLTKIACQHGTPEWEIGWFNPSLKLFQVEGTLGDKKVKVNLQSRTALVGKEILVCARILCRVFKLEAPTKVISPTKTLTLRKS